MVHLIGGLIGVVLGLWGIFGWWDSFGMVLRGLVPLILLIGGLIATGVGIERFNKGTKE